MQCCYGCGFFFDIQSIRMPRPFQSQELAKIGIEHVLCEACAIEFGNSSVIARVVEKCVCMAIADTRCRPTETNNHGPMFERAMRERNMNDNPAPTQIQSREEIIRDLFEYHPPTNETIPKFREVTEACIAAAIVIDRVCPPSADRTVAIRHLQDARMSANCSIANNGASYR